MLRLGVGSPLAAGAWAALAVTGICRVGVDRQIRGLPAPLADGQANKSVCFCPLLLPKRPWGCEIFADVIFHFPDLLKPRADY